MTEYYKKTWLEVFKCGYVKNETIQRHVEKQILLEKLLPKFSNFYCIVDHSTLSYRFMGKQQESITGYSNDEFMAKGVEFFLQCLHPDEVQTILTEIYPKYNQIIIDALPEMKKRLQMNDNFRFRCKNGKFINLTQQGYVLETDKKGSASLVLCHVAVINSNEVLPLRMAVRYINDSGVTKTLFSKRFRTSQKELVNITDRELDILRNLASGKTSKEIGDELFISPHTVDTHRRNLLKKLDCKSVVQLAQVAYRNGVL